MISYKPFWRTIDEKGITVYELMKYYRISGNTIQKLRDNENLTMRTIDRLCRVLHRPVQDIVEVIE